MTTERMTAKEYRESVKVKECKDRQIKAVLTQIEGLREAYGDALVDVETLTTERDTLSKALDKSTQAGYKHIAECRTLTTELTQAKAENEHLIAANEQLTIRRQELETERDVLARALELACEICDRPELFQTTSICDGCTKTDCERCEEAQYYAIAEQEATKRQPANYALIGIERA